MSSPSDNIRPLCGTAILVAIAALSAACGRGTPATHAENAVDAAISRDGATSPLLQKWCSDCHAPPRPTVHTSREWPGVVAQMQTHRITQGLARIDAHDLADLLGYLQSHAKP